MIDTQLSYLRAIGAVGPPGRAADPDVPADLTRNFPRADRLPWYKFPYQRKEVVHTCMINMGPWRCAAARQPSSFDSKDCLAESTPLRRRHGRVGVGPPHATRPVVHSNVI